MADGKIDLENGSSGNEPFSLNDLPNNILGEIVEKLDLVSRLRTRKVSRCLRTVVDQQKVHYQSIGIFTAQNRVDVKFDANSAAYAKLENNFLEVALNDLAIAFKKPKFQLEELTLSFEENAGISNKTITRFFKSLEYPIHVKMIYIPSDDYGKIDVLPILALMEPGALETIVLGDVNLRLSAKRLVKMEQWKKVKNFNIKWPIPLSIKEFLHLNSFIICVESISPKDVILLRDVLSESANFECCSIESVLPSPLSSINEIRKILGSADDHDSPNLNFYWHPTSESNKFLEFNISPHWVSIQRQR